MFTNSKTRLFGVAILAVAVAMTTAVYSGERAVSSTRGSASVSGGNGGSSRQDVQYEVKNKLGENYRANNQYSVKSTANTGGNGYTYYDRTNQLGNHYRQSNQYTTSGASSSDNYNIIYENRSNQLGGNFKRGQM